MRTYKDVLEELKSKNIVAKYGEFYDYIDFPLEEEFYNFFTFGQDFLDRDDLGLSLTPARLYFNTNISINGLAYKSESGYSLIEIYKGCLFLLFDYYTSRENLFQQPHLAKFKELADGKNVTCSYILFQFVLLYIFYHEVGHLIQRTDDDTSYLEFLTEPPLGNSIIERHMREHDADWFAVNQLAFHIVQSVETIDDTMHVVDPNDLATMSELALAGIYLYYIRQSEGGPKLYFEEKSHPHAAVRICYMIIYLLDTLSTNVDVQLDQKQILSNAIRLGEALLIESGKNIVEDFSVGLLERIDEIETYIDIIRKNSESYPHLASKKINSKSKT